MSNRAPSAPAGDAWAPQPAQPRIAAGEVHVWLCELADVDPAALDALSAAELARAAEIVDGRRRERWARSRAVLRALLGAYGGAEPAELLLSSDTDGKPELAGRRELDFSLSHSGGLALYAISRAGGVGVDVELARGRERVLGVAARAFGRERSAWLQTLPPAVREREFLALWVRREAELKCLGTGPGKRVAAGSGVWTAPLELGPRAAAAVAVARPPRALHRWRWR